MTHTFFRKIVLISVLVALIVSISSCEDGNEGEEESYKLAVLSDFLDSFPCKDWEALIRINNVTDETHSYALYSDATCSTKVFTLAAEGSELPTSTISGFQCVSVGDTAGFAIGADSEPSDFCYTNGAELFVFEPRKTYTINDTLSAINIITD